MAKILMTSACRENQGIVCQATITQDDGAVGHIDIDHLGHDHSEVSIVREHRAQWIGNIARR